MKKLLLYCLFLASQVLPVANLNATPDEARAILEKVGSAYRAPSNLEIKGTSCSEQHSDFVDSTYRSRFTLLSCADDKFRFESKTQGGTSVVLSDGHKQWSTNPYSREYFVADEPQSPFVSNFLVDFRQPTKRLLQAKVLRQEDLQTDTGIRKCDVVEVTYEPPPGKPRAEYGNATLWVDRESYFVWKVSVPVVMDMGQYGGKTPSTQSTTYSSIRTNIDVPAETFTFTPPPGVTEHKTNSSNPVAAKMVGLPAPEFKLKNLDGKQVSLASFKGKIVLLDFWATWCGPCRTEMPKLQKLSEQFQDKDLIILGIDVQEDAETVRRFVKQEGYKYPILLTEDDNSVIDEYAAHAYPYMVLIDKNGIIEEYKIGSRENSEEEVKSAFLRVSDPGYRSPKPLFPDPRKVTPVEWPEPLTAADFVQRGHKSLTAKQHEAAIQDANKALELKPDYVAAERLRAQAFYDAKRYDEAIMEYSGLIKQFPDWPQLYNQRGLAYSYAGKFEVAIPDYTKAISLDRYIAGPYNNRGWSYLELGDVAKALEDLNHAIDLSPDYVRAHENRARAFAKRNDHANELEEINLILRMSPSDQWAKNRLEALTPPHS